MNNFLICLLHITLFIFLSCSSTVQQKEQTFLPKPRGEHVIGYAIIKLEDHAIEKNQVLKIWYPVQRNAQSKNIKLYMPDYESPVLGLTDSLLETLTTQKTYAQITAPILNKKEKYPTLFFLHAYAWRLPEHYTHLIEHLASCGYIVISFNQKKASAQWRDNANLINRFQADTYQSFTSFLPELQAKIAKSTDSTEKIELVKDLIQKHSLAQEITENWKNQVIWVLSELKKSNHELVNHIDFERLGIFGHELGGATAGRTAHEDINFKAALNLDGLQFGDLYKDSLGFPYMSICTDEDLNFNQLLIKKSQYPLHFVQVKGAHHYSFSDLVLWDWGEDYEKYFGRLPTEDIIHCQQDLVQGFFDHYLLEKTDSISIIAKEYSFCDYTVQ